MAHFLYAKNWVCWLFLPRGARSRPALFHVLNNLGFVWYFSLLLAQTMPAANPPAPQFLLPDVAQPRHYALDLTIVPTESTFLGTATIDLTLNQSLSFLWLNGKDLTVESAVLRAGSSSFPAKPVSAGGEFLGFVWQKTVGPGPAQLEIHYRGQLSQKAVVGIFRKRSAADWYVFTTFTPIEARRAFPCFDEPRYKTPWELTLHVKRENVALSNTRAVSERDEPGGMKRIAFAPTVPLPSYLIAFAVGPFEIVDAGHAGKNGVPVRIVTPRGRAAEADAARAATPQLLARLEEYTGIPYPFDKLDHLALIEGAFGAIENPGLITYRQRVLLSKSPGMRATMAHELAHQWFGNLVTMSGWEDVWLSEGFATWMAAKLMDEEQPAARRGVLPAAARNRIMAIDAPPDAYVVREPMASREQMRKVYGPLVYEKGAAGLNMLENWLGEQAFRAGIQRYLMDHKFATATTSDFATALGQIAGRDLRPVLSSFLDRAGVPVVTAELRCDSGLARVVLRQDREGSVPVCLKAEGVPGRCVVLEGLEAAVTLQSCPSWLFANAGASGYYRSLLEPKLFLSLARQAASQLTAAERLTFVQDVSALVMNGRLPATQALGLLHDMAHDPEPLVAAAARGGGSRPAQGSLPRDNHR
jgi:cytosol alanyl aminopeptidase